MNRYFGVHVLDGEWHALLPRYLVLAERIDGKRVLDIGCGTGIGSSLLLELGASHVDGVDYRPGVLDLAKIKHAKESLTFQTMLWEDLDFPDDTFDMVVCLDPTTPVTDPNLLEEVSRVLTDEGEYVCSIERRTIEGYESLLPKYGYSAPAENVQLGQRDEQAPQIGELTNYFDNLHRVLQRPEYNYVFEREQVDPESDSSGDSTDFTLCTEDSHIAGVELIFCGAEEMKPPADKTIRLPYYRLAERLNTVIRDLNMRQGPGGNQEALEGPVEPGLGEQTSPEEETNAGWDDDSPTDVRERPDDSDASVETEVEQLTDAYTRLRQNFEQLREQTQAAMVAQERSIDQLVELLRQWRREDNPDADFDVGGAGDLRETDIYDAPEPPADQLASDSSEADDGEDLQSQIDRLREEHSELVEQKQQREDYIDELEKKLAEVSDREEIDEAGDEQSTPAQQNSEQETDSTRDSEASETSDEESDERSDD